MRRIDFYRNYNYYYYFLFYVNSGQFFFLVTFSADKVWVRKCRMCVRAQSGSLKPAMCHDKNVPAQWGFARRGPRLLLSYAISRHGDGIHEHATTGRQEFLAVRESLGGLLSVESSGPHPQKE